MSSDRIVSWRKSGLLVSLLLCFLLLSLVMPVFQGHAEAAGFFRFDVYGAVSHGQGLVVPSHQKVWRYGTATIYCEAAEGYFLGAIIDNNNPVPVSSPYQIKRVTAEHYVQFYFYRHTYDVNASVPGGHGSVSPTSQEVHVGDNASIDIQPDPGYSTDTIIDNGQSMPISDPYVIQNVTDDHNVSVTFAIERYTVDASVQGGHGTVNPPTQSVAYGGTATIDITPDAGYGIASITDNGQPAPVTDPYRIKNVSADHDVVVTFSASQFTVDASVSGGHGTVDPETQSVGYDATAAIDIYPDAGYHIATISDNGELEAVSNPYVINNVREGHQVEVDFAVDTFDVDASVAGGNGTVNPASQTVAYGDTAQIDITADPGYHIASITDNGSPAPTLDPYFIGNITADHTVVVTFALNQYTVDALVSGGNGTVDPPTQPVLHGGTASIAINPDGGFHTATITDNGVPVPTPLPNPYVINNVTEDHTVVVTFASTDYMVAATVAGHNGSVVPEYQLIAAGGSASIAINPDPGYHIVSVLDNGVPQALVSPYVIDPVNLDHSVVAAFEADEYDVDAFCIGDGSVEPASQTVLNGGTASITINTDPGSHVAAIFDNGVPQAVGPSYAITNVREDHEVLVFINTDIYDVNAIAGDPNGTVDPLTQKVVYDGDARIDITPNAGYHAASIVDNGAPRPVADPYVIEGVSADHNVVVGFAQDSYDIDAAVEGDGGTVTPPTQSVLYGGAAAVDISPDAGRHIETITDNGQLVEPISNPYVITGVQEDHEVVVTFDIDQFNVTAAVAGGHGTVAPPAQTVHYGDAAVVDFVPDEGYYASAILDNGLPMPVSDPYVIEDVEGNHNVVVTFAMREFEVDAAAVDAGGSVSPATQKNLYGSTAAIDIETDPGYDIAYILDNGEFKKITSPYVVADVTTNHDVMVGFKSELSPTWYLAEGSTAHGFSTYVSIENPTTNDLNVDITYMLADGTTAEQQVGLPADSQVTIDPTPVVGAADFSTMVRCVQGETIAVDRTMSWTGPGAPSPEGHNSIGVTSPETSWYLPEGSSAWGFETWTLVQNQNDTPAIVTLTYMPEGGGPVDITRTVEAHSRATYSMSDDIGTADASTRVISDLPVIAERSMYRNERREGHCSIGAVAPSDAVFLAEGSTAWGFSTFVLVQNPNDTEADVTLTFMTPGETVVQDPFTMPANSRRTVKLNDIPEVSNTDLSTMVQADVPIIAERSMYWGAGTPLGEACHDSIGLSSPYPSFCLPDGQTSAGRETWTLVQNPNDEAVQVQLMYLLADGAGASSFITTVPAQSRRTFNMADFVGSGRASVEVTCLTQGRGILVERSMYWNDRGAGTDTIGGFSDFE
ncbi:MAG: hypothetical protein KKF41_13045 [Actinobacteria bacterium]|nr:hypothetical protein [Actinomycetota bacterium]MBU1944007.1 hypothetical protein [Actinomycetota bacterium]MBU2688503.1 hypothetical protein [Actinomycetota bacterium]